MEEIRNSYYRRKELVFCLIVRFDDASEQNYARIGMSIEPKSFSGREGLMLHNNGKRLAEIEMGIGKVIVEIIERANRVLDDTA